MEALTKLKPKKKRVRDKPGDFYACGKCTKKKRCCRCPGRRLDGTVSPPTLPSYELPTSNDEYLHELLLDPTNEQHWDAFKKRHYLDLRRNWTELQRVIQCLQLFVKHSKKAQYAELLKKLENWVDTHPYMRTLSKYNNMGVEQSEFSAELDARMSSVCRSSDTSPDSEPPRKKIKKQSTIQDNINENMENILKQALIMRAADTPVDEDKLRMLVKKRFGSDFWTMGWRK